MVSEVLHYLNCRPGGIYADCTLGGAGHARSICRQIRPHGIFIGLDQDEDAISHARRVLQCDGVDRHLFHVNFTRFPEVLSQLKIAAVDGILLDLGISSHHLDASGRGFTFQKDEPLDMRMDTASPLTARDLIAASSETELADMFRRLGEVPWPARVARRIVEQRRRRPIATTNQLVEVVTRAIPKSAGRSRRHPATRVFMALRIAVNKELERLDHFLGTAVDYLKPGGRLCVLSFHSLEDRRVKHRFRDLEGRCVCPPELVYCRCGARRTIRVLTRKVVRPTDAETAANARARSTCLRACEKLSS